MKTKEEIRKELIKILEDTPMYMTRDIEEAIKTKKILEIAIKNPKKIADKILKLFSQQRQESVGEIDKMDINDEQAESIISDFILKEKKRGITELSTYEISQRLNIWAEQVERVMNKFQKDKKVKEIELNSNKT